MSKQSISIKRNLKGKIVVPSGKWISRKGHVTRETLEKTLKSHGAFVRGMVSGKTDLLIYDKFSPERRKFKLAKKHNTPMRPYKDIFSIPQ
jgi:NAD-dependent DNA ligase